MRRALKEGYAIIPEGEQIVRIAKIDETDYAKFDKLVVYLEDVNGATARENFNFTDKDGNPNAVAEGVYTRMCRAALDDQTLDECDTRDLINTYVRVEIEHSEGSKGGTFANVKKWLGPANGFDKPAKAQASKPKATSAMERLVAMKAGKK